MMSLYFLFGGVIGFLFGVLWEISTDSIGHWACHKGYHFHHSLFGPLMLFFIPWVWHSSGHLFFLLGGAAGIVFQHTLNEGFIFITRETMINRQGSEPLGKNDNQVKRGK